MYVCVFPLSSLGQNVTSIHRSLYLVFLPLDGALQLVQLVLQLRDDVRFSLYLVEFSLPLALQQGALHLCLEERTTEVTSELRERHQLKASSGLQDHANCIFMLLVYQPWKVLNYVLAKNTNSAFVPLAVWLLISKKQSSLGNGCRQ